MRKTYHATLLYSTCMEENGCDHENENVTQDWTVRKSKYLYPAQKTTYLKTKSSIYYIIRRKNNVKYIIINVIDYCTYKK